jgi:hypothetical protein
MAKHHFGQFLHRLEPPPAQFIDPVVLVAQ